MHCIVAVLTIWLLLADARPAYAYIDPGSGGMLMQLLLGGIAGAAVLVRLYWNRFLGLFRTRKPHTDPP